MKKIIFDDVPDSIRKQVEDKLIENWTPADAGIQAAKEDDKDREFIVKLCDDFKDFVLVSMAEGHHKDFDDHFAFLEASLDAFQNLMED